MIRRPPRSTLFPYTRSSDLRDSGGVVLCAAIGFGLGPAGGGGGVGPARSDSPAAQPSPKARRASTETVARCGRSEEHTSELQSQSNLVCRLLLEKKKT